MIQIKDVYGHSRALIGASAELQDDEDVVHASIEADPFTLIYASERYRNNKEIVGPVLRNKPYLLDSMSEGIQNDMDFLLETIPYSDEVFHLYVKQHAEELEGMDEIEKHGPFGEFMESKGIWTRMSGEELEKALNSIADIIKEEIENPAEDMDDDISDIGEIE